ncbi:MAG TPA: ribonuclease HII [candidate division WOR-3 bacterium]|uniref:Ribonuclease HII n=1 Tax=candidate division WOR-3 bacterium TaxID=2052148 RepID=A0A7C0VAB0_UNCW3|nr:ribonuclease HII [candidate division WOR-3 bacterium]
MIDIDYWTKGVGFLCGIDEVGRGPLAGPVVAASVILPEGCHIEGIKDSKKLSPERREELFGKILNKAISIGLGIVEPILIDRINILQATYEAMRRAILSMKVFPEYVIVDGRPIPGLPLPQEGIVKGDSLSISIGAASIVAKVVRDRIMEMYDLIFPQYGFARNKGYGTKEHIEALFRYGPCPIHRRSFRPVSEIS